MSECGRDVCVHVCACVCMSAGLCACPRDGEPVREHTLSQHPRGSRPVGRRVPTKGTVPGIRGGGTVVSPAPRGRDQA